MGFELRSNIKVTKRFSSSNTQYGKMSFLFELCRIGLKEHFESEEIHQLLSNNVKFDVVLVQALCPLVYAIAGQVEAPIVGQYLNIFHILKNVLYISYMLLEVLVLLKSFIQTFD